ncbi:MAG: hypothetical protein HYS38_07145 [Acidobacteria bacterium]|nr:hypothetical protein [Acidobacteriota bacterium]
MRMVSLIASSTEMVCALSLEECLVGRSQECDYPPFVRRLPVCTKPKFHTNAASAAIDRQVKELLRASVERLSRGGTFGGRP